jgi:hypothetical protein
MNRFPIVRCFVIRWTWLPIVLFGSSLLAIAHDSGVSHVHFQRPDVQTDSEKAAKSQVDFRTPRGETKQQSEISGDTDRVPRSREELSTASNDASGAKPIQSRKSSTANPLRTQSSSERKTVKTVNTQHGSRSIVVEDPVVASASRPGRAELLAARPIERAAETPRANNDTSITHKVHRVQHDDQLRQTTFRRRARDYCASCGLADECACEPSCGLEEVSCGIGEVSCGIAEPGCFCDEPSCGIGEPDCGDMACGSCVGRSGSDYWCFPVCLPRFKEFTFCFP